MTDKLEVIYTLDIEQDDQPVRGNFASGDDEEDRKLEDSIIARLNRGDVEAWCFVKVTATLTFEGEVFKGRAGLGGCSYDSEREIREQLFDSDEYGLKGEALDDLKASLKHARNRGNVASAAQSWLNDPEGYAGAKS